MKFFNSANRSFHVNPKFCNCFGLVHLLERKLALTVKVWGEIKTNTTFPKQILNIEALISHNRIIVFKGIKNPRTPGDLLIRNCSRIKI